MRRKALKYLLCGLWLGCLAYALMSGPVLYWRKTGALSDAPGSFSQTVYHPLGWAVSTSPVSQGLYTDWLEWWMLKAHRAQSDQVR